jgi:hypothetical protein
MGAALKNGEMDMRKKTLVALAIVVAGTLWVDQFFDSETKTADLYFLPLGLMMICGGVERFLEDYNPAEARVFRRIANFMLVFVLAGLAWGLLRQL